MDYMQKLIAKTQAEAAKRATTEKAKTDAMQSNEAKQKALSGQYLQSVQQQADVAQQGVGRLEQAQREGLAATRAQTGKVLASGRGMLGGGRGVAMLRSAALDRGAAEGAQRAQYAGQIQQATQQAAQARSEALAEQGKAIQAEQLISQQAASAAMAAENEARALAEDYVGWLSDDNRNEIAANLRAKAALQPTMGERQAWLDIADSVENGMELGKLG